MLQRAGILILHVVAFENPQFLSDEAEHMNNGWNGCSQINNASNTNVVFYEPAILRWWVELLRDLQVQSSDKEETEQVKLTIFPYEPWSFDRTE